MKKYIFFVVGVMCTLLSHTAYAIDLNKSDANIIGHVLEKKTGEHLPYKISFSEIRRTDCADD